MREKSSNKDKLIIFFFIIIAIGALTLGFLKLNYKIKNSFNSYGGNQANSNKEKDIVKSGLITNIQADTDEDGLSDYDELNIYHTSIYLPDTDSDGYSDKIEIDSGNNPNCPTGQNCSLPEGDLTAPKAGQTNLNGMDISDNISFEDIQNLEEVEKIFSGDASIEEIKKILLEAGMSKTDLAQIPDEEILKIYREAVAQ